ncbi:molybdopterin cofactor-binding domain-containing protein [Lentzea sp. NPDC051208]|uniref:molybdopterin cofactor-binding domain-containing protein n=1 Tax=Lentzea sp. NPDC051208 TaxID=3154642 RepID=UPI003419273E
MASQAFGWSQRKRKPARRRTATSTSGGGWPARCTRSVPCRPLPRVTVGLDCEVVLRTATQDIGTGTIISQIVADAMGVPLDVIQAHIGDTALPAAGLSAASATIASVSGPVDRAARAARDAVVRLAVADERSPLSGVPATRSKPGTVT